MMMIATDRRHQRADGRRVAGQQADRHDDARDRERDEADRAGREEQHRVSLGRELAPGTPARVITRAPSAGPPAPPAGSSTFAPLLGEPEDQRAPPRHEPVERRPQRPHEPEHRRQRAAERDGDPPRLGFREPIPHVLDPRQLQQQHDAGADDDDEERDALDDAAYVQLSGIRYRDPGIVGG